MTGNIPSLGLLSGNLNDWQKTNQGWEYYQSLRLPDNKPRLGILPVIKITRKQTKAGNITSH
jgi:hypothetical protein